MVQTELDSDFPPLNNAKPSQPPSVTSQPTPNQNTTWAHLFNSNRVKTNGTALEYIPSTTNKEEPSPPVKITNEEVAEELRRWDHAIVGYVIGAKPPYKLMKQFIERRWKAFGDIDLYVLKAGVFVFNFHDEDAKLKVLELGPWSYYDKPLILKPWSSTETYDRTSPEMLPIWVRLPHLKLHLWSAKSLSKIASQVGRPLFTDRMTALRQRLAYARICIEVDKNASFPQHIEIVDYDGNSFQQAVEYEWIPTVCEACKQFGHKVSQCTRSIKQQWKPVTRPKVDSEKQGELPKVDTESSQNWESSCTVNSKKETEKLEQPMVITTGNKFDSLSDLEIIQPLEVSPLAIEGPSPSSSKHASSPLNLAITVCETAKCPEQEMASNAIEEKVQSPCTIRPPGTNEDHLHSPALTEDQEAKLSKSQRKKMGKLQHALAAKNKAPPAKSPFSSSNLK